VKVQRSQIFRAFARGTPLSQIAESCGVSYSQAWLQLKRAVAELERKNPSVRETVCWQQYLVLMRIVDQALAAFRKSAEDGAKEITSRTIKSADDSGELRMDQKIVTHSLRTDAGNPVFLEIALKALREIRDLYSLGAEAESKLKGASGKSNLRLETLLRTGAIRLSTRWGRPAESGANAQRPAIEAEAEDEEG
jgi:hypothetical protein